MSGGFMPIQRWNWGESPGINNNDTNDGEGGKEGKSFQQHLPAMPVVGKPGSSLTLPVRPKLSRMRPVHSKYGNQTISATLDKNKKTRPKKGNGLTKYEMLKRGGVPDYTDVAYREAVTRLRYLLNESYVPPPHKYPIGGARHEESDEESGMSVVVTDRTRTARLSPYRRPYFPPRLYSKHVPSTQNTQSTVPYGGDPENANMLPASPELVAFIEKQEEYIDQLEKEAQYCRDELSQLLGKVKELISENESLQEQQKSGLMKVMLEGADDDRVSDYQNPEKYRKRLEGPLIVFESRISELEAQLTQSKIDVRKAQEETEMYKRKLEDCQPSSSNYDFYKQIENLQREKRDLNESLAKLQASINQIREKEIDASKKVQRTLDVVDKTQFEKQQAEMEVYRLKSELELQHDKLLEVISEQTRKVSDERGQAERRYLQHVERLNADLVVQRDALSKMQMEVEKHLRVEEDLKRDLAAKNMTIENVKKELNHKIASLQAELSAALTERDSLEQELNTSKMSGERTERQNKQESSRLQVEVSALRQRLDRGDAELIHCRRENLRLLEQISTLEKELTLYKIKLGEKKDPVEDEEEKAKEKILNSRISDIESKHVKRVSELEGLIENQSQVMAQLKAECQSLTQKLEESTARHKQELENLQGNLNTLNTKMETNFGTKQWTLGDNSKELEDKASERTLYKTIIEDRNLEGIGGRGSYGQQRTEEKFLKTGSYEEALDQSYGNPNQPYSSIKSNILGGRYGNSSQYGEVYETGGDEPRKEVQGVYEPQNEYPNYEQPGPGYQLPEQQPTFQPPYQDTSSFLQQEQQASYQEQTYQEQPSYQEPSMNYQDLAYQEPDYQEQPNYQEQILSYQEQPQEQIVLKEQRSAEEPVPVPPAPSESAFVPLAEPAEAKPPPEPKPPEPKPPAEAPKTTTSQRFQRAAELSRQSSKSEESPRGKLTSQARSRNPQSSRTQQKTLQSGRFGK